MTPTHTTQPFIFTSPRKVQSKVQHIRFHSISSSAVILLVFGCLLLVGQFHEANCDVVVISPKNETLEVFVDFELGFSQLLPDDGLIGKLVLSQPETACSRVEPPPRHRGTNETKWFLLAARYPCPFQTKVDNAIHAGYDGIIIYNIDSSTIRKYGSLLLFTGSAGSGEIPAVLITYDDGMTLKRKYLYEDGFSILLLPDLPFNLNGYLLPFFIVIGVCLLIMFSFMIYQIVHCIRDRRRRLRHRLSSKHLKKIPTAKYKKGLHRFETCSICLDDYVEGEKVRILPCGHVYHLKCIDPWLTKNRRNCPVCKGKVVVAGMSDVSDTDSDSEHQAAARRGPSERTPLLADSSQPNYQEQAGSSGNRNSRRRRSRSRGSRARNRANQVQAQAEINTPPESQNYQDANGEAGREPTTGPPNTTSNVVSSAQSHLVSVSQTILGAISAMVSRASGNGGNGSDSNGNQDAESRPILSADDTTQAREPTSIVVVPIIHTVAPSTLLSVNGDHSQDSDQGGVSSGCSASAEQHPVMTVVGGRPQDFNVIV